MEWIRENLAKKRKAGFQAGKGSLRIFNVFAI